MGRKSIDDNLLELDKPIYIYGKPMIKDIPIKIITPIFNLMAKSIIELKTEQEKLFDCDENGT